MAEKKNRSKVNERVGAVRMMNCGQKATCIAYRSSTDIDVQFEDRTVVRHRKWSNFKKGKVFNPNIAHSRVRKDRVGQSRKMNCGETATCIVYRKSDDIDVQFECGAVVEHVDWKRFVHGGVMCPTHRGRYAQIRTGQTRTMYNGQQATCVGYRRDNDIDVQFEDGTLVEHCRWKTFEQGKIRKPGEINPAKKQYADERVGRTIQMEEGMATCVAYKSSNNIDVRFDDGTVVRHQNWQMFARGRILKSGGPPERTMAKVRVGMVRQMNCGETATCIGYRRNNDIDVQFACGTIVKHRVWGCFSQGAIECPSHKLSRKPAQLNSITTQPRVGYTNMMRNGQNATCIAYRRTGDIDVRFEDGTVVKNCRWRDFKNGIVVNPSYGLKQKREGTRLLMNGGMYATCVAYRHSRDIDVLFEDGSLTEHRRWNDFLNGSIMSPKNNTRRDRSEESRVGTTFQMRNGETARCTAYRGSNDVDVVFSDGTIVQHVGWGNFRRGLVSKSFYSYKKLSEERLGAKKMMARSGLMATCVEYRSSLDIDVLFEDGTLVRHRTWKDFEAGNILRPEDNRRRKLMNERVGTSVKMANDQMATCIAYRNSDDIDVQFEDGTVVEHRTWKTFSRGRTRNPSLSTKTGKAK